MHRRIDKLKLRFTRYRLVRWPRRVRKFKLMSRHPFAVPFITIGGLVVLTAGIYFLAKGTDHLPEMHDAKIVIISHDHLQQTIPSKGGTVGAFIHKLHITLNPGDVVEPDLNSSIDQDQFRINIYRAKPVEIVDGIHHNFTYSASKTPRAIAIQAGAKVYPEDDISRDPIQDFLKYGSIGEEVVIDRATPIQADLYGTHVILRTHAKTIRELIKEKGIHLIKNDKVQPGLDTPVQPGIHVAFIRTGTKTETVTENLRMPVHTVEDPTLAYGTTAVRQEGSPGQQVVTYEIKITNNVETARKVIQKIVTRKTVTQVVVLGTSLSGIKGDMALAGIRPSDYNYADYIISHESGWNPRAYNPSGAYGLCQALPGSKMSTAGSDWATNPITQLRWCNGYAVAHYGSWYAAYSHWLSYYSW